MGRPKIDSTTARQVLARTCFRLRSGVNSRSLCSPLSPNLRPAATPGGSSMHFDDALQGLGGRLIVATAFALVASAASVSVAQDDFWAPRMGPWGCSAQSLARQPDGDLYTVVQDGSVYRSTNGGYA